MIIEAEMIINFLLILYTQDFSCLSYGAYLQDSTKDVERLISKERYDTVTSLDEGIDRMAREKYAFLWTRETMDYLLAKNCTFTTLKGKED